MKKDDIQVQVLRVPSSRANEVPITEGLITYFSDRPGFMYDIDGTRKDISNLLAIYNVYADVLYGEKGYEEVIIAVSHPSWIDTSGKAIEIEMVMVDGSTHSFIAPFSIPNPNDVGYPTEVLKNINQPNTWYVTLPKQQAYYGDVENPVFNNTDSLILVKVSFGTFSGKKFNSEKLLGSITWPHKAFNPPDPDYYDLRYYLYDGHLYEVRTNMDDIEGELSVVPSVSDDGDLSIDVTSTGMMPDVAFDLDGSGNLYSIITKKQAGNEQGVAQISKLGNVKGEDGISPKFHINDDGDLIATYEKDDGTVSVYDIGSLT